MTNTNASLALALVLAGCGGAASTPPPGSGAMSGDLASCAPGAELTGASYTVEKSRFTFGSTPTRQDEATLVRWVGADGALAIFSNGYAGATLNGGAPEASLPDWSNDPMALAEHVRAYFAAMGVASCQVATPQVNGGSGGRTAELSRTIDGIPVGESLAYAHFVVGDKTTSEGFYWPTIPADIVTAARALRDRLADPAGLAAYKALLPAEAQGDGQVIIRHTNGSSTSAAFTAVAVYDVFESNPLGRGGNHDFDADGKEITVAF
jgi:hypothetical protein